MRDVSFIAANNLDLIEDVTDAEILAAFQHGRREVEIDMDAAVEISGGDLAQLDVEFD